MEERRIICHYGRIFVLTLPRQGGLRFYGNLLSLDKSLYRLTRVLYNKKNDLSIVFLKKVEKNLKMVDVRLILREK